jgi:hypothetical protein
VQTVIEVLRREAKPLDVGAIKRRLAALGISDVDAVWAQVGPILRAHADVVYAGKKYGLAPPSVAAALAQLGAGLPAAQRTALLALVQAELDAVQVLREQVEAAQTLRARLAELEQEVAQLRDASPPAVPSGQSSADYERAERRRAARERNARIEAMTKVADLAAEVEELVAKRATNEVLLESTRTLVAVSGLEQIGTGGERVVYDESQHEAIGDTPGPGVAVIVVRPGYRWRAPGEMVLISRAVVRTA